MPCEICDAEEAAHRPRTGGGYYEYRNKRWLCQKHLEAAA